MAASTPAPWERQPGESTKAFAAFQIYLNLGYDRTYKGAYRAYSGRPDWDGDIASMVYFHKWTKAGIGWVKRADAYDEHMESIAQEAKEEHLRATATEWAERYERMREAEYEASMAILERAKEMLAGPLYVQVSTKTAITQYGVDPGSLPEGAESVVIVPARWNMADAISYAKAASGLARLAIGSETGEKQTEDDTSKQTMMIGGKVIEF